MNRPLIITAGIVTLLFIIGLWVYLLAYGAPKAPREVFTNLGVFSPQEGAVRVIDPNAEEERGVQLSLGGSALQQLSTRAVAGFAFATGTGHSIRYVERGTGYVFEIDLDTGIEKQRSVTTIPHTSRAVFSPNAESVAITTFSGYLENTVIGTFTEENTLLLTELPSNAQNIAFEDNETLYFTLENNMQTTGYRLNLNTLNRSELFSIEIPDALMHWGSRVDGIYAQTKPTRFLEGYLYEVLADGTLVPATKGGYGLNALVHDSRVLASIIENGKYTSHLYTAEGTTIQAQQALKEKCVFDTDANGGVWCAAPIAVPEERYVEDWYKGVLTSEDYLWYADLEERTATLVADLPELAQRTLDVSAITLSENGEFLLFTNKLDGALWLYKISP